MVATLRWTLGPAATAAERYRVAPLWSRPYGLDRGANGGSRPPRWVGDDHEPQNRQPHSRKQHLPRYRRRGMWLRSRRMLHVHAELRYVQVRPLHRGAPHRVGTAGRRRPYLPGPDLPDPL